MGAGVTRPETETFDRILPILKIVVSGCLDLKSVCRRFDSTPGHRTMKTALLARAVFAWFRNVSIQRQKLICPG